MTAEAAVAERKVPRRARPADAPRVAPASVVRQKIAALYAQPSERYAQEIYSALKGKKLPEPSGYNVLIAVFVRPNVTAGGVYLSDQTVQEDEYQGRAGLVLAVGPDAYAEDKLRKFSRAWVKSGDWVIWPVLENSATRFKFGGVVLAVLPDDKMLAKIENPMDVY